MLDPVAGGSVDDRDGVALVDAAVVGDVDGVGGRVDGDGVGTGADCHRRRRLGAARVLDPVAGGPVDDRDGVGCPGEVVADVGHVDGVGGLVHGQGYRPARVLDAGRCLPAAREIHRAAGSRVDHRDRVVADVGHVDGAGGRVD